MRSPQKIIRIWFYYLFTWLTVILPTNRFNLTKGLNKWAWVKYQTLRMEAKNLSQKDSK